MRRRALWVLICLICLAPVAWSAAVSQRTEGHCSPVTSVGQGTATVTIECKGVERDQINELIKIFNEGLRNFQEFKKELLERQADVDVRCDPDEQGGPEKLLCSVENKGTVEARNLIVSFAYLYPTDTVVQASAELGIRIEATDRLFDPTDSPSAARVLTAFVVHIPRVAPKDRFRFTLRTTNPDNLRAARQVIRIRKEIADILQKFGDRLAKVHPYEAQNWKFKDVISARIKEDNFYTPRIFSYEKGRFPVAYFTEEETYANAINADLYARFKKEFIDIYQNRPKYLAPVIRIKSPNGDSTYASSPPYVLTCGRAAGRMPGKGESSFAHIQVPDYQNDKC